MTTLLSSMKKRQKRLSYHVNITKISPQFSWTAINWTFQLLSLKLVFPFHLISLGNPISIPLQSMHLRNLVFFLKHVAIFSPSQLWTIYKSQIRPSLEYCYHIWGGAPKSSLHLLDRVQSKAIRLINNPSLTNSLQSLSHRRLIAGLPFSTAILKDIALWKSRILFLIQRGVFEPTHSHPFQVTLPNPRTLAHKSSFIPRTSKLLNSLPPTTFPESYNLSSFKSNINKFDLISLST